MANKFEKIGYKAEVLKSLYEVLQEKEKGLHYEYRCVGKSEEQDTNWRTGELLWEDEEKTIPRYRNKYADVQIPDDELSDERKMQLEVVLELKTALEKMI